MGVPKINHTSHCYSFLVWLRLFILMSLYNSFMHTASCSFIQMEWPGLYKSNILRNKWEHFIYRLSAIWPTFATSKPFRLVHIIVLYYCLDCGGKHYLSYPVYVLEAFFNFLCSKTCVSLENKVFLICRQTDLNLVIFFQS